MSNEEIFAGVIEYRTRCIGCNFALVPKNRPGGTLCTNCEEMKRMYLGDKA